jgi:hypothetical protein
VSWCHFGFFRRTPPASIHCFDEAEDRHFPAALAPMYEPTGPSRSAACRPAMFHALTALGRLCFRRGDGRSTARQNPATIVGETRDIGGTRNFRDGLVRRALASKLGNPRLEPEKLLPLPWHSRGISPHGPGKSVVRLIGRRRLIHWYR